MWLALPVVVLVILAVLGTIVVSGIFAAVLLPIAAIVLLVGLTAIWRRARDPEFRERLNQKESPPLGGTGGVVENQSSTTSTPDEVVDTRRRAS